MKSFEAELASVATSLQTEAATATSISTSTISRALSIASLRRTLNASSIASHRSASGLSSLDARRGASANTSTVVHSADGVARRISVYKAPEQSRSFLDVSLFEIFTWHSIYP